MSLLHSGKPAVPMAPPTVYRLSRRIVDEYTRLEETKLMVQNIIEHEFKETLWNYVKSAAKEGAKEGYMEVMQMAPAKMDEKKGGLEANNEFRTLDFSSSQTPTKEAVFPSSTVGENDPASIKGSTLPCINNKQLIFVGDVESRVFTNTNLLKQRLRVELRDGKTGSLVSAGHEASAELQVGLLDGVFEKQRGLDRDQILMNQLKPRKTKSPYLIKVGSNRLTLENGVGELPESLAISDSSLMVQTSTKTFCLSLVPSDPQSSIQGATSNAFTVLDKRGKANEKHHPPHGDSEVWRLDRIAKRGEYDRKLEKMDINFVSQLFARIQSSQRDFQKIFKHDFNVIERHLMEYQPDTSNHMESALMNQGMGSHDGVLDQGVGNPIWYCTQAMQAKGNMTMETYPSIDPRSLDQIQNLEIESNGEGRGGVGNLMLYSTQSMQEQGNTAMETDPSIDPRTLESQNLEIESNGEHYGGVDSNPLCNGQGMVGYFNNSEFSVNIDEYPQLNDNLSPLWYNNF